MSDMVHVQSQGPAPVYEGDLFAPDILANSYPEYRAIRDMGDMVWSPRLNMFVVARYVDVKAALHADDILISGQGVFVNEMLNGPQDKQAAAGVLITDEPPHDHWKKLLMKPMMPKALADIKERVQTEATSIVDQVATGETFDGVSLLASHLPTRIVAELVGLQGIDYKKLLEWSAAVFDFAGPVDSPRTIASAPMAMELVQYIETLTRDALVPGSWADNLFAASEAGDITIEQARTMVQDYAAPSLDTTILATAELLWGLATEEGAFAELKLHPELIPGVVYEAVRLSTPIRGFTRFVTQDFQLSESVLPAGSRAYLLNASANRDERHYPNPDQFDIRRNPRDHLGWGYGRHLCAGMHLARLEMETLLGEIIRKVDRMEADEPTRLVNNSGHGFVHIPLRLFPVR